MRTSNSGEATPTSESSSDADTNMQQSVQDQQRQAMQAAKVTSDVLAQLDALLVCSAANASIPLAIVHKSDVASSGFCVPGHARKRCGNTDPAHLDGAPSAGCNFIHYSFTRVQHSDQAGQAGRSLLFVPTTVVDRGGPRVPTPPPHPFYDYEETEWRRNVPTATGIPVQCRHYARYAQCLGAQCRFIHVRFVDPMKILSVQCPNGKNCMNYDCLAARNPLVTSTAAHPGRCPLRRECNNAACNQLHPPMSCPSFSDFADRIGSLMRELRPLARQLDNMPEVRKLTAVGIFAAFEGFVTDFFGTGGAGDDPRDGETRGFFAHVTEQVVRMPQFVEAAGSDPERRVSGVKNLWPGLGTAVEQHLKALAAAGKATQLMKIGAHPAAFAAVLREAAAAMPHSQPLASFDSRFLEEHVLPSLCWLCVDVPNEQRPALMKAAFTALDREAQQALFERAVRDNRSEAERQHKAAVAKLDEELSRNRDAGVDSALLQRLMTEVNQLRGMMAVVIDGQHITWDDWRAVVAATYFQRCAFAHGGRSHALYEVVQRLAQRMQNDSLKAWVQEIAAIAARGDAPTVEHNLRTADLLRSLALRLTRVCAHKAYLHFKKLNGGGPQQQEGGAPPALGGGAPRPLLRIYGSHPASVAKYFNGAAQQNSAASETNEMEGMGGMFNSFAQDE